MKRLFMNSLNLLNKGREREGDREKSMRNSYVDNKAVKRKIRKITHSKCLRMLFHKTYQRSITRNIYRMKSIYKIYKKMKLVSNIKAPLLRLLNSD